jgi:long-chain acyl-CoA synthetase
MPLAPRDLMVFQATACSELPFHQGDLDFVEPSPEEAADILLTSGTTNQPKGVALTHANLLAAARNINQFIGNTAEDREAVALPLSHSFGLGRVRCQIVAGAALILTHGFQFPKQLFGAMKSWRVTGLSFVPAAWTMLTRLTGDRLAEASQGLRYIEIGSAALSRSEKERLIRLFPHTRLCMHYGLTEASRSAFIEFHQSREHLDSIGRPAPNVYIRIVDEQGADVAARQIGRIQIRGDHVMQGYWKSGRCEPIAESSIYSGDLGYRDEDGYLYLCGREDDVINVGGRKVHPSEVEQALLAHQGIADAVCVATADPLTGEAIRALLVAKTASDRPSPYAIADFLTQHLEPYKIPASFEWVMAIPRNPSGKIDRRALAARTAAGTLTGIEVGVS